MGGLTLAHIKSKKKALSEYYTKNSWLLHNETTYLTDWYASPTMRTNPGNKMTKRTMFLTCQLVNGMNDFRFSQVDFIKLLPTVRTFGKRCYICKCKELFNSIAPLIAENCTVANSLPLFLKYYAKSLFFNRLI